MERAKSQRNSWSRKWVYYINLSFELVFMYIVNLEMNLCNILICVIYDAVCYFLIVATWLELSPVLPWFHFFKVVIITKWVSQRNPSLLDNKKTCQSTHFSAVLTQLCDERSGFRHEWSHFTLVHLGSLLQVCTCTHTSARDLLKPSNIKLSTPCSPSDPNQRNIVTHEDWSVYLHRRSQEPNYRK